MINDIIFFCYGDSSKASTWSNVPYLFTKTLIDRGIEVHRIDISPNPFLSKIYNKVINPITRLFGNECQFRFTKIVSIYTNYIIKKNVKKYSHADYCIFTCFDYYNKFSSIKTLLYCDWTFDEQLKNRLHRELTKQETRFLQQQSEALSNADFVISLFPQCANHIRNTYPKANVKYLDGYVINSFYNGALNAVEIIKEKRNAKSLLFVGTQKYIEAARKLVDAFLIVKKDFPDLSLNIIGMVQEDFGTNLPERVHCYGYLRKDNPEECRTYYDLLLHTTIIVNADPQWGGYSSIVESMYFYTPVIVSPYPDFVAEFGKDINFGIYNEEFSGECIAKNVRAILKNMDFGSLCQSAHDRVKTYDWDSYVGRMLKILENDK